MKLALSFDYSLENKTAPELAEIVFITSTGAERVAYRRKSVVYDQEAGSFQWTSAVKAFATLAIGTRLNIAKMSESEFKLEGLDSNHVKYLSYHRTNIFNK